MDMIKALQTEYREVEVIRAQALEDRIKYRGTDRGDAADRKARRMAEQMAEITEAIAAEYEQRGGDIEWSPEYDHVPTADRVVDSLRSTDLFSRVPDAMEGARHSVKRGRNKKGATAKVTHRGRATVIGSHDWDHERLASLIGDRAATVADYLTADLLASVRRLTLGADALDVTRAADAILAALDVPDLAGTDAMAWSQMIDANRADGDAMSCAILDDAVAVSRHRCGIAGYYGASPDVSTVRRPNTPGIPVSVADLADVTAPTVETASWPNAGPRSSRPRVPRWRKVERETVEPKRGDPTDDNSPVIYWHGPQTRYLAPCTVTYRNGRPELVAARWWTTTPIAGRSALWTDRVHIGNVTVDRGKAANAGRPTTTAGRKAREVAAAERAAAIPTLVDPTEEQIGQAVESLAPNDSVHLTAGGVVVAVKRSRKGDKYRLRSNGQRLPESRTVARATEVACIALL